MADILHLGFELFGWKSGIFYNEIIVQVDSFQGCLIIS